MHGGSTFLQTGTVVVVGVVLIIAVVGGLIQAYQNPHCTAVCQATATAAAITWGYIGVAYLTADNSEIIP